MHKTPYLSILKYYWNSKTKYSVHSPFVFDFVNNVLLKGMDSVVKLDVESERNTFLNDKSEINFIEFGAGSRGKNGNTRIVSDVAKSSLSGFWQCRLMYNIIQNYNSENILEIGTSLGISGAYLAKANLKSKVVTLEGNPSSADLAELLFDRLGLINLRVDVGEFGETLEPALKRFKKVDCAFVDGNHRKGATIEYFNLIKQFCHKESCIIIDDIYWSQGMNEAWNEIIADPDVTYSIDLFRMGIVFFKDSIKAKQNFMLIDAKWKPWSIGLFG